MFKKLKNEYEDYKSAVKEYNENYQEDDSFKSNYNQLDFNDKEEMKNEFIKDTKEEFKIMWKFALIVLGVVLVIIFLIIIIAKTANFEGIISKFINLDVVDKSTTNNNPTDNSNSMCGSLFDAKYHADYYDNGHFIEDLIFSSNGTINVHGPSNKSGTYTISNDQIIVSFNDGSTISYKIENNCDFLSRPDSMGLDISYERE